MKKILSFLWFFLLSLPKTLYFNFKALPLSQAIILPILIGWNTKIISAKSGVIQFPNGCRPLMVRLGFAGSPSVPTDHRGRVSIYGGSLTFEGRACFAAGSTLDNSGVMTIGKNFSSNKNTFISCSKEVTIGEEVMLGWNVQIYDASGHTIYYKGQAKHSQASIKVGNHVWICSYATLLKGAEIGDGSIVAWRSLLTKSIPLKNVLVAGNPAVVKSDDISWGPYNEDDENKQ